MAALLSIAIFHGLKGLVALSFSGLFSFLIFLSKSKNRTEVEEIEDMSRRLANGESPFKLLIPVFQFLVLLVAIYSFTYFAIARYFDGMQMASAFVATLILISIGDVIRRKENPIKILTSKPEDFSESDFTGTFRLSIILVTLVFMAILQASSIEAYPIFIRGIIVLVWFFCYLKTIGLIQKRLGIKTFKIEIQKNITEDKPDGH